MSRWHRSVAALAVVALWLAGCTAQRSVGPSPGQPRDRSGEQASVAELADLKDRAGIEPCPTTPAVRPAPGGLPDLTLPCLGGGRAVRLSALRGTPTVLNLWASWCRPCRDEIPLFQQLHERAGDKALRLVGIDVEDPNEGMALAFAAETGMTYPQLRDLERATLDAMRTRALPLTLFVDADGRLVYALNGPVESAGQLGDLVEQHLGVVTR